MGIIGDAFGKLFDLIWSVILWLAEFITQVFENVVEILTTIFEFIYALIDAFIYLLYMVGVLAVKLFLVIFNAAKLLWSLVVGFGRTLASLNYTPRSGSGNGYSVILGRLFNGLNALQLDSIAYIILFCLWFITAISAIKLISSIRVGGD
ncbi:hypothetical protein KGR20_09510 [Cytobacillus oceanisediminis]|uniref:hypothetical protein n=1 Tax=Bacillaceae TaxID=186817 RepID=UPI000C76A582|nr:MULTISPECIES: hypothetical protein [Bacillaceae]MBQ6448880.1 hypothetical protein [Bacillus sp. (in: firmicutes)]MBZ9534492.1 hypothetical protein [Cytobacillus oceanisediminis]UTI41985.1 hypothetical protein NKG37_24735 [Niallia sp. RD1]